MNFDYIIVGAGAAGCVLANRLSEDPANQVLLLEAGGSDRSPVILVPKGFYFTMTDPKYTKKFATQPFGTGSVEQWSRGRMIGGSTGVNGMVWNRGWKPDYDSIEAAGNPGWGWDTFVGAYKSIEDHALGASNTRGVGGPVGISVASPPEEVSEAFMDAAGKLGMNREDDLNGSDNERVGYVSSNIANGLRVSAAEAYLHPVRQRPNLTVLSHSEVGYVLFDGKRATGVRVERKGVTVDYSARKEVLLAGGSLDTPLLLERSGIGDPDQLRSAGVKVVVDSPNVGERLHEHHGTSFQFSMQGADGYNKQLSNVSRQVLTGTKYLMQRDGVMSFGGYNVLMYYKSDPKSDRPDTQGFFTPISTAAASLTSGKVKVDKNPGMMFLTYPLRPTSTGSIHITGNLPSNKPTVIANFLETEHDRRLVVLGARKGREIMAQSPISRLVREETLPGTDYTTDEQILENALNRGGTGYHTLGTCAMGPNDDDVVDARLRVRGVEGLRVVDASVFPHMPSGNNNAPTQALAWHAAQLILEDNS
ncbi:GMC oxidoreductase [Cryobacterium suzukii]|uniref:GMC oxidoreductase n=1 Tax=Cryobacterium suzukii TaxID=1259198 RepID=A0A4R9AFI6_9MICO|nr:GMC family oxidoreductase N-terminal domain-containing protein [Cryobacterium suzukii]TFD60899.1 GMC oxidoreductase [Cryobacterium suzukii]